LIKFPASILVEAIAEIQKKGLKKGLHFTALRRHFIAMECHSCPSGGFFSRFIEYNADKADVL